MIEHATRIQKRFRMYFTRKHISNFRKRGHASMPLAIEMSGTKDMRTQLSIIHKNLKNTSARRFDQLADLLSFEIKQRRTVEREGMVHELLRRHDSLCQRLVTNIEFWLRRYGEVSLKMARAEQTRIAFNLEHEKLLGGQSADDGSVASLSKKPRGRRARAAARASSSASMSSVTSRAPLTADQELSSKGLLLAASSAEHIAENCSTQRSWISHTIRATCRRLSLMRERFLDVISRLAWLPREQAVMARVVANIKIRLKWLERSKDSQLALEWLREHLQYATDIAIALDAQQESLILDEMAKLVSEERTFLDLDMLLTHLCRSIEHESQFAAERVFLDRRGLFLAKGSDESLRYSNAAFKLKKKQTDLMNNVVDPIKLAIQAKLDEEDKAMSAIAGFPNDEPALQPEDMPSTIAAVLLEKHKPGSHFSLLSFIEVYYVQPWLSHEAVEDVRMEDEVQLKELAVDTMQLEIKAVRDRIRNKQDQIKDVEIKLTELTEEIDYQTQETANGMFATKDDDELVSMIKRDTLLVLNEELKRKTLLKEGLTEEIEKMNGLLTPAVQRVDDALKEIITQREEIDRRAAERRRLEKIFFDLEERINADGTDLVSSIIVGRNDSMEMLAAAHRKLTGCLEWLEHSILREKYNDNALDVSECEALGMSLHLFPIEQVMEALNSVLNPSTASHPLELRNFSVETRKLVLELDTNHYHFVIERLDEELAATRNYGTRRTDSEAILLKFQQSVLSLRWCIIVLSL